MAFSGSQITRLGNIAITRGLTGSFAGKTENVVTVIYGPRGTYDLSTPTTGVYDLLGPSRGVYDLETQDTGVYDV